MRKEGEDKEDSMESSTIEDFLQGTFPMTATTLFGLEDTLAQELEKIGATEVTILASLSSYLQPLEGEQGTFLGVHSNPIYPR